MQVKNTILMFLLWVTGLAAAAQFAKIAVPFGHVQDLYPQYGAELGWLLTLISLVGAVFGIVGGSLVNGFGAKRVLIWGLGIGAAMSFWQASLPGFGLMLISRTIEGLAHLAIVVAAPTLLAQLSPDRLRGIAMTIWGTFFGVSFVLVAWLGERLVTQGGLSLLFLVHGIGMVLVAMPLAMGLEGENREPSTRFGFGLMEIARQHLSAYRSPFIAAPGIGWLFYTFTFVSLLTLLPQLVSEENRAWLSGSMPMISIVSSLLLVPILHRYMSGITIVVIGLVGSVLVVLFALTAADLVLIGIALFAVLGLVQGATFVAIPEINASMEERALSYGVMAQTGNIGNLIGTPILLAIHGLAGSAAVFVAAGIAYAMAILAHFLLYRQRRVLGGQA